MGKEKSRAPIFSLYFSFYVGRDKGGGGIWELGEKQGYIFWPFYPNCKTEFKGLEKRKGKGGKEEEKKRVIIHMLKYLFEA